MANFDVVVVGAGPGGLAAAITAAKHGARTLVIEQNQEIGYPVKTSAFTFYDVVKEWGVSRQAWHSAIRKFYLASWHSHRAAEAVFQQPYAVTLNFHTFLQELAFKAVKEGATILLGSAVEKPIIADGKVKGVQTGEKKICAGVVIDASGPAAVIAKNAGVLSKPSGEVGVGMEYELVGFRNRDPESMDLYVGEEEVVPVGYGWLFPTGQKTGRVGVCTVLNTPEKVSAGIRKYQDQFTQKLLKKLRCPQAQPYEIHGGAYGLNGAIGRNFGDGFLVVGDAASQASPLLGEGIRYALTFGKFAGETAARAARMNSTSSDVLEQYNRQCAEHLKDYFAVASNLLQVPTDEYWDAVITNIKRLSKEGKNELILRYLRCELSRVQAIEAFPELSKYLSHGRKGN